MEKSIPIYGDGKNIRDWLYVEDHCNAIDLILEKSKAGKSYVIGGNYEKTNIEIAHTICNILDKLQPKKNKKSYTDLITFVKDRAGHDFRYALDTKKIKKELGWESKHNFKASIEKTVSWYLYKFQKK